jgi:hypothetical protein
MGAPLIANLQSALFYPPTWIYFGGYVIGGLPVMVWMQGVLLTAHLIWAGLGMAALTRRLGLSPLAQTVSGLAFSLSGFLVARAWFASINAAAAWMPWVLVYTFDVVNDQKRLKSVILLGLATGLQLLAGHAQTSWYTMLLAAGWCGYWSLQGMKQARAWEKIQRLGKDWVLFGAGLFLGAGIAAVQLVPTAEYLVYSQRASAAEYEAAMTYSLWPWRLLGLIAPNLFGNPAQGDYWGYGNYWEDAIYVGLLPLLLGGWVFLKGIQGLGSKKYKDRPTNGEHLNNEMESQADNCGEGSDSVKVQRLVLFLLGVSLISLVLALGKNTPIFPWLYRHVPTFDMFQAPTRFSIWMVFSLAIAAGLGAETWRKPVKWGLYWMRLGTAGAFAVSLGAGAGWFLLKDVVTDFKPTFVPALAFAGVLGVGAGLLSLNAPGRDQENGKRKSLWQIGVAAWISLDLILAGWGLNPGIALDFYTKSIPPVDALKEMVGEGRVYLPPDDEYTLRYDVFFNFETFEPTSDWDDLRQTLLPNLNMLERIPYVNNYDPLIPQYYATWMEQLETLSIPKKNDLLDFMAVTVLEQQSMSEGETVRFAPRKGGDRVRWVPCSRFVETEEEALALIMSGRTNLQAEVVIFSEAHTPEQVCYVPETFPKIVQDTGNKIVVEVESEAVGWLVLADSWYPGWKARVDGQDVEIHRANYAFRAIEIPEGRHEVVFVYRPASFYVGGIISLCMMSGIGTLLLKKTKCGK